ncbi:MAG: hypothetical protein JRJ47_01580 [Deltaproteobacteria bacterium]|nr:hypothetical protein [Deltaproteobacteria bacterium]
MKPYQPKTKCLLPSPDGHVPLDDSTSQAPMRLTRHGDTLPGDLTLNYGQYFKGIAAVISNDSYASLIKATTRQLERDVFLSDIDRILICAEKHGSDYHPAKIEVVLPDAIAAFVMNVAVTARGRACLSREHEVLQVLNRKYDFPYLPRTYFQDEASPPSMFMFLADWFEGYHEFHLSVDPESGSQKVALWDSDRGHVYLSELQTREIYRQAAMILTRYYDVETFEQIFPWHHAAGDFVVKAEAESVNVRLITARQYTPMIDSSEGVTAHDALLFFLLNLSLRMRLDRLDGVGAVAWANDGCVQATLEGFMEGLGIKEQREVIPGGFLDAFIRDIKSSSVGELSHGFRTLVDACDQSAPDIGVLRNNLEKHTSKFYSTLQNLGGL